MRVRQLAALFNMRHGRARKRTHLALRGTCTTLYCKVFKVWSSAFRRLGISFQIVPRMGVSLVQWDALRHLDENPGASLHDLAVLTFQSDQSFGTLAVRMINRGLIERVSGPGRAVRHRLTDRGRSLRKEGDSIVERVLQASFAPLTPAELSTLDSLLLRVLGQAGDGSDR